MERLTLTFVLCGMTGCPLTAGRWTDHTPKVSRDMGVACRSQLSIRSVTRRQSTGNCTEITNQVCGGCVGGPFSIRDVAIGGNDEAHFEISLREGGNSSFVLAECVHPFLVSLVAVTQCRRIWLEPGVELNHASAVLSKSCHR